ncbi:response regulator [Pontibacter sp. Tf4]|uniref:response regulator n=1 Tax=Pontibacter sp. Tf4 TaxID=2761620 RepID=UPI001626293A|nr:response regulator [Pontibacter sp. Tf4]MBB6610807.1 response regulator [Pontibacter sp. Tf4]
MKVFLIDDDQISNFLTEQVLAEENFASEIHAFESAEEALNLLLQDVPQNIPDIIFLDLNMPSINGWEFLDALRPYSQYFKDSCHIYILTSSLDLADTVRARDYKLVTRLIHKPFDTEEARLILQEVSGEPDEHPF